MKKPNKSFSMIKVTYKHKKDQIMRKIKTYIFK